MDKKVKVLAFYLPQFHPTEDNDNWWGKGFTEWTNVAKAKKLFPGHYQPKIPSDLGFYDLRVSETREAQARMAKEAGIDGFCYWHYYFGNGKELLERPFKEVLESGKPDFPFCLAWANESWYAKLWDKDGRKDKLLIEQKYDGEEDYTKHFYSVLPAFKDKRYITIDDKPMFMIYRPFASEKIKDFMECWNELAKKEDLKGIYWIANNYGTYNKIEETLTLGFDAVNVTSFDECLKNRNVISKCFSYLGRRLFKMPYIVSYEKASKYFLNAKANKNEKMCPSIITGWDHTPRSGWRGFAMTHYTPKVFEKHVKEVLDFAYKGSDCNKIVFLKSWNEWGEGNYIEPDLKYGKQFLDVLKGCLDEYK